MDARTIQYKNGMPYYPVTFPVNEADGLLIEDLQLQQIINYLNANGIKAGFLASMDNFEFLKQCTNLEYITIELKVLPKHYTKLVQKGKRLLKEYDSTPLYSVKNLRGLSVIDLEEPYISSRIRIDLSKFSNLELFSGEWKYIEKIEEAKKLKTLRLNDYENETLVELATLKNLDTLELNMAKIKSLEGCENLESLQCLYLYYNRSLCDISSLSALKKSLKTLRIENCKKICDFSVLEELKNLESLTLVGNNEIPDIAFVKHMKSLKTFIFTMNIQDGNLNPCLELQYACCAKGKRHYNLKDRDLPKGEYIRGNENIDMWRRFE